MTSKPQWGDLTTSLSNLIQALGLDAGRLKEQEDIDVFSFSHSQFPTGQILQLSVDVLQGLVDSYGQALIFQVKLGDNLWFDASAQSLEPGLANLREKIRRFSPPVLDLRIEIDKTQLLQLRGVAHPHGVFKVFLFHAALASALSRPLVTLEKGIYEEARGDHKLIILVPEYDSVLNGTYLAVIGRAEIDHWRDYAPQKSLDPGPVKTMHDKAIEVLNWIDFGFDFLTPLQLLVQPKDSHGQTHPIAENDALALAVYDKLVALSIIYTSPLIRRHKSPLPAKENNKEYKWTAVYGSEDNRAELEFGNADAFAKALQDTSKGVLPEGKEIWELPQTLGEMAKWAYEGERDQILKSSDRLHVLQGVIARALRGGDPRVNYAALIRNALEHFRNVEFGHKTFVEKKLEEYFSRVRDVEKAVDELITGVNDEVQSLVKSLTDSMLAAVGVIIGTFLAAVFVKDFNATIFRIGLGAYIIYLIGFPGIVTLTSIHQRYQHLFDMFNARKKEFSDRLSPEQVEKGISQSAIAEKERWFTTWFNATIAIYIVVVILLTIGFFAVPAIIPSAASGVTATPVPTIVPAITPTP